MKPPKEWELPLNAAPDRKRKHKQQMFAWLHYKLDLEHDAMAKYANSEEYAAKFEVWASDDESAIYSAKHGNIGPLRQRYPHLAEFLHLPKRRGRRPKARTEISLAKFAAEDVQHVRKFWQEQYNRSRRKEGDPLAAENVVVAYYEQIALGLSDRQMHDFKVTVDAIKAAMKPSGKHKNRAAKLRGK